MATISVGYSYPIDQKNLMTNEIINGHYFKINPIERVERYYNSELYATARIDNGMTQTLDTNIANLDRDNVYETKETMYERAILPIEREVGTKQPDIVSKAACPQGLMYVSNVKISDYTDALDDDDNDVYGLHARYIDSNGYYYFATIIRYYDDDDVEHFKICKFDGNSLTLIKDINGDTYPIKSIFGTQNGNMFTVRNSSIVYKLNNDGSIEKYSDDSDDSYKKTFDDGDKNSFKVSRYDYILYRTLQRYNIKKGIGKYFRVKIPLSNTIQKSSYESYLLVDAKTRELLYTPDYYRYEKVGIKIPTYADTALVTRTNAFFVGSDEVFIFSIVGWRVVGSTEDEFISFAKRGMSRNTSYIGYKEMHEKLMKKVLHKK